MADTLKSITEDTREFVTYYTAFKGRKWANNGELAAKLGYATASSITEILKFRQNINPDKYRKFKELYLEGRSFPGELHSSDQAELIVSRDTRRYNTPSINTEKRGVPYFDVDFIGGFDLVFNSQAVNPSFYIDFLPFNDADYWVNVTGKSMGPLIAHGDIIALKEVKEWKRFTLMGEIYGIVTSEYRTVKILSQGEDKDHFTMVPYNKSGVFHPQPIPKDIITNIFKVKAAVKKFF